MSRISRIRAKKLTALAAARIPEYLRNGDLDAVEKILRREIGVGLDALGLSSIGAAPENIRSGKSDGSLALK